MVSSTANAQVAEKAYERSVDLVERLYLYPDQVVATTLLESAAENLADDVPWLLVEGIDDVVYLRHGSGEAIGSVSVASIETLAQALAALETLMLEAGYDLQGVDVRLAILQGMTNSLDRYTRILAGERLKRFDVRLKGTLVGVGATLALQNDRLVVTGLVADAPAIRAGLALGDQIVRIDGVSTINMPLREATRRIRGEKGTSVEFSVMRQDKELDLSMDRQQIVVPNVRHKVLEDKVGYIKIEHFSQRTQQNLRLSLKELEKAGALNSGLVLDLRGNTGGSLKHAAKVADEFLTSGMLLRTVGPDGGSVQNLQSRMDATDTGTEVGVPVILVVNDRTASGSEIVAGALLELERAALVGQRTYGKGTVQMIYPLDDDQVRLKLTVAEYVLAGDRRITSEALVPDVAFADVVLSKRGARYLDWGEWTAGAPWEEIVPVVTERAGWRDQPIDQGDVQVEMARRAVMRAKGTDRDSILQALKGVAAEMRIEQQQVLKDSLAAGEIDWRIEPLEAPVVPDADVTITATPKQDAVDVWTVRAEVENLGKTPIYQAVVELGSESSGTWDDLVIPVGYLPPGERVVGQLELALRTGIPLRQDLVDIELRSAGRPVLRAGQSFLRLQTSPTPTVTLEVALQGEGKDRRANILVRNRSDRTLNGVEVYFSHPGDVAVELLDRASRISSLDPRGEGAFSLGVRVGEDAPERVPLQLVIEAEGGLGKLASWIIELPLDGSPIQLQAPSVRAVDLPVSQPIGRLDLQLELEDDAGLEYAVVYVNGDKAHWIPPDEKRLLTQVPLWMKAGLNRIVVIATDDTALQTRRSFYVWGEDAAAVDATTEQPRD